VRTYKIASGDITFVPLLEAIGKTGKNVFLSTGGSTLRDVETALNVLTQSGVGLITLLHCVSSYPPQFHEMNIRALSTLKDEFGLPVGISDHSPGNLVPIAAVTMGASLVEKHVTFDRELPGPDHSFAMTMNEFAEMVSKIRLLESALGDGQKIPTKDELARQHRFRRGIYDPKTLEPLDTNDGLWLRPHSGG
jgi:sialic acid synthase SpsE